MVDRLRCVLLTTSSLSPSLERLDTQALYVVTYSGAIPIDNYCTMYSYCDYSRQFFGCHCSFLLYFNLIITCGVLFCLAGGWTLP